MKTLDEVLDLLSRLSMQGILDLLQDRGIKTIDSDIRNWCTHCPIAQFLKQETGIQYLVCIQWIVREGLGRVAEIPAIV